MEKKSGQKRTQKKLASDLNISERTLRRWKKRGQLNEKRTQIEINQQVEKRVKELEEVQREITESFLTMVRANVKGLTLTEAEFRSLDIEKKAKLGVDFAGKLLSVVKNGNGQTNQTQINIHNRD